MAGNIKTFMQESGIAFIEGAVPASIEAVGEKKKVTWTNKDGSSGTEDFDTVMFAVGREVCTSGIGLDTTGVKVGAPPYARRHFTPSRLARVGKRMPKWGRGRAHGETSKLPRAGHTLTACHRWPQWNRLRRPPGAPSVAPLALRRASACEPSAAPPRAEPPAAAAVVRR